jgi:hypothetical protein
MQSIMPATERTSERYTTNGDLYAGIRVSNDRPDQSANSRHRRRSTRRTTSIDMLLWELGLEDLVHGQLTPRLAEVGMLDEVLRNASQIMYYKGFKLCPAIAKDVYVASNLDFARKAVAYLEGGPRGPRPPPNHCSLCRSPLRCKNSVVELTKYLVENSPTN